jgi:hypothetical protein
MLYGRSRDYPYLFNDKKISDFRHKSLSMFKPGIIFEKLPVLSLMFAVCH